MLIGKMLRIWRTTMIYNGDRMGITVRDAAKMIGISHSTYSRIERGKSCDAQTMVKLIKFLFD